MMMMMMNIFNLKSTGTLRPDRRSAWNSRPKSKPNESAWNRHDRMRSVGQVEGCGCSCCCCCYRGCLGRGVKENTGCPAVVKSVGVIKIPSQMPHLHDFTLWIHIQFWRSKEEVHFTNSWFFFVMWAPKIFFGLHVSWCSFSIPHSGQCWFRVFSQALRCRRNVQPWRVRRKAWPGSIQWKKVYIICI